MAVWSFRDYLRRVNDPNSNDILDWLRKQGDYVRAKIDLRIISLQGLSRWPKNQAQKLKNLGDLWEVKVKCLNKQYRPLGYMGPGRREFTLLIGTTERDGKLPPDDCRTAQTRIAIVEADRRRSCEHVFHLESTEEEDSEE